MTIFVSVAAYRDPELVPTVLDCLAKAKEPDALRIVVCWQHLGDEDVSAIAGDPRVELLDVDARQSRGACWARAEIMERHASEDWFLQVDSHTRFAPGWDARLIELADRTGSAKPILSCYPPTYDPTGELAGEDVPTEITLDRWSDDGLPILAQRTIPNWERLPDPVPARFVAGGFLFAPGTFAHEVPYDPNVYFQGEEISVSVRAYTWGFDLFHPTDVLSWHYYIRPDGPRHWNDHDNAGAGKTWFTLDKASRRRVRNLLRYPSIGRYGVGPVRTVAEYEAYAGVGFRACTERSYLDRDYRMPAGGCRPSSTVIGPEALRCGTAPR
ncbi:GlcNAc-transferase family protein [Micromonospora sp. NPDC005367]|uniref:GlcNAc-transferase family protein n=1 Tax=Micromonospora sp. NPDC005367 TaxID=3155590 RepID=UPI0033AB4CFA